MKILNILPQLTSLKPDQGTIQKTFKEGPTSEEWKKNCFLKLFNTNYSFFINQYRKVRTLVFIQQGRVFAVDKSGGIEDAHLFLGAQSVRCIRASRRSVANAAENERINGVVFKNLHDRNRQTNLLLFDQCEKYPVLWNPKNLFYERMKSRKNTIVFRK